jgi:hypothetical protein
MTNELKDLTTGETRTIHICYQCDSEQYPRGKPIDVNDWKARPNEKGEWICGDCQIEELHKRKIRVLQSVKKDGRDYYSILYLSIST